MRYPSWMMDQMEPDAADHEPPQPAITIEYCRSCGAPIWWGETRTGRLCPFDIVNNKPTQESHFKTCTDATRWSRKGAK